MAVTDRTIVPSPALDPKTLDFERDPLTGRLKRRHWVDNAVWTIWRTKKGSVRSAPDVGHTVAEIQYIDEQRTPAQVVDRLTAAVAKFIERNLIRIDSIAVDLGVDGAILYEVNYTNLVTGRSDAVPSAPRSA